MRSSHLKSAAYYCLANQVSDKWGRFREKKEKMIGLTRLPTIMNVEESLNQVKNIIHKAAYLTLVVGQPGKRFINGNTWLWNDDDQMKGRKKKCLSFLVDQTLTNGKIYKNANREAKRAIVITGAVLYKNLYDKLDTRDGERDLFRLVKSEHQRFAYRSMSRDGQMATIFRIEEFVHLALQQTLSTFRMIPPVSAIEVEEAIKRMKSGKATGPDDNVPELGKV